MIDLHEKQMLFEMATNTTTYGSNMPALIQGQWICPHCKFEHDNIDTLAAHMATKCDGQKSSDSGGDDATGCESSG